MRSALLAAGLVIAFCGVPCTNAKAQDPIMLIIKEGITKVIKAVDLRIQRLQNNTIRLQNAQQVMENTMSRLKLDEITGWVEKQRILYQDYFDELWRVKSMVAYYHRIREISQKQLRLVDEYKRSWSRFRQDNHFTPDELAYLGKVYTGILNESVKNIEGLFLVIHSFSTQMTDAKRLEIIDAAAERTEAAYHDLQAFNRQNILLSLQRARDQKDLNAVKQLYGR